MLEDRITPVESEANTNDNRYIVSGGYDHTVRIWNLNGKTQNTVLQGHTHWVACVAITSNNKYIASGGYDNTVRI